MVKGFTSKERELIKSKLHEKGKQLFQRYGLKKTTMSQLTKAVGIAQGSFYIFYESKEELYFEILEQEEAQLKWQILQHIESPMNANAFKNLLMTSVTTVLNNPFIQHSFQQEHMEQIIRKLPADKLEQHIQKDTDDLQPLLLKWQEEGSMEKVSPDVITAAFRSFVLISLHQKEVGEELFQPALELMAEGLAQRLFKE
ncbi:DNA-binding transcriptional regulator EnvR [Bacillus sp. THAF10]|uniref:TetR/AcrR family transcriptional regulator n=1 Tax=Bacillus sp. THAF10 TaxID=2587848 RepID=UPI001267886C|nr:TetR/AcrR family transcriptional regulator [Bacillus sp. THAF10]QFT89706.1 DNA-binding transcriptional regulator EnvR [Bacillus sp. THAF10]